MGSACCADNRTVSEKHRDEFLLELRYKPNTLKYAGNTQNVNTFNLAWASPQFGGNVFSDLGAKYVDGKKYKVLPRNRKNTLHE